MFKTIHYQLDQDGIGIITLDAPGSANTITDDFKQDLENCIRECSCDDNVKGMILTSAKKDFVAGGDLKEMVALFSRKMSKADAYALARNFSPVLRQMETCGKPVVAALNGSALGGGLEIALACHYRIVADNEKILLGLPEVNLGLMPGAGGTQRLSRLIGIAKALPFMLEGKPVSPAKALEMGIVHQIVPSHQLLDTAKQWILAHGESQQAWDKKGFTIPGGAGFADAALGALFNMSATRIAADTSRNLPAPIALLTAVARGTCVPFD
ncbi:MAG TPA: enoyl-CoA hydratase-related protein, partial [Pseudomonadales bacterium]|nr:enoyl-CoA hydratase-related protein [Pseudomonadales bacterium]